VCSVIIDNFKSFRQLEILIAFLPNICAIAVTRACSPEGVWEAVTNSTYAPCGLHGDHIAVSILTALNLIKTQPNVTLLSLSRVKCLLRPVCVYFCALKSIVEPYISQAMRKMYGYLRAPGAKVPPKWYLYHRHAECLDRINNSLPPVAAGQGKN
jgi:hypothetical protein